MALVRRINYITDRTGNALADVEVDVYTPALALATIYADSEGATVIAGSRVTTDSNGRYSYWARAGSYVERLSEPGLKTVTVEVTLVEGGGAGGGSGQSDVVDVSADPYNASPGLDGAANMAAVAAAVADIAGSQKALLVPGVAQGEQWSFSATLDLSRVWRVAAPSSLATTASPAVVFGDEASADPIMMGAAWSARVSGAGAVGVQIGGAAYTRLDGVEVIGKATGVLISPQTAFYGYNTLHDLHIVNATTAAFKMQPAANCWTNENTINGLRLHTCTYGAVLDASATNSQCEGNLFQYNSYEGTTYPIVTTGAFASNNVWWLPRWEAAGNPAFNGGSQHNLLVHRIAEDSKDVGDSAYPNFVGNLFQLVDAPEVFYIDANDFVHVSATANRGYVCKKSIKNSNTGVNYFDYFKVDSAHHSFIPGFGSNDSVWVDIPCEQGDIFCIEPRLYNEENYNVTGTAIANVIALNDSYAALGAVYSGNPYLCAFNGFGWGGSSFSGNSMAIYPLNIGVKPLFRYIKIARAEVKNIRITLQFGMEFHSLRVRKVADRRSSAASIRPVGYEPQSVAFLDGAALPLPERFGQIGIQADGTTYIGIVQSGALAWKPTAGGGTVAGSGIVYNTDWTGTIDNELGTKYLFVDPAAADTQTPWVISMPYSHTATPSDGDRFTVRFGGQIALGGIVGNQVRFPSRFIIGSGWQYDVVWAPSDIVVRSGEIYKFFYTTRHPSYPSGAWFFDGKDTVS